MGWRQVLPREHGTWAFWLAPFVVGCGVARRFGGQEVLLLVSLLAGFLGYGQLATWARLRRITRPDRSAVRRARALALGLGLAAAVAGAALVAWSGLIGLIPIAAVGSLVAALGLVLVRERAERALAGQLLAPIGLAGTAAAAHYVARGAFEPTALALWGFCALFFLGGVLYVRMKIAAIPRRDALRSFAARVTFALPTLLLEAGLLLAAAGTAWLGGLSAAVMTAFVPTVIQAAVGTVRLHRPAVLKRIGIISSVHAVLFVILVSVLA